MSNLFLLITSAAVVGLTLLFGSMNWFQRPSVADRLASFHAGAVPPRRGAILSVESFRDVVGPLTSTAGSRLGELFGVRDSLAQRLERIDDPTDAGAFRIRQFGWMAISLIGATAVVSASPIPVEAGLLLVLGAPLLTFLLVEHHLSRAIEARQAQVLAELPVVAEQLGMLLSTGYSLGAALGRIASRGSGACAEDLRRVRRRIQHGLSDIDALTEWADRVELGPVRRLVSVLALNREAANLGNLIAAESRSIRAQSHRDLIATIERRTQHVWIPVTVATLLPGVIFMAIPFVEALSVFSAT